MLSGEATNTNFIVLVWPDQGSNSWSTSIEATTLTITPMIRFKIKECAFFVYIIHTIQQNCFTKYKKKLCFNTTSDRLVHNIIGFTFFSEEKILWNTKLDQIYHFYWRVDESHDYHVIDHMIIDIALWWSHDMWQQTKNKCDNWITKQQNNHSIQAILLRSAVIIQ